MIYDMTPVQWLKHVIFHPIDGFEDMRWKKQGSLKIALVIVFFLFVAQVVKSRFGGFAYNMYAYTSLFSIIPILIQSVVYYGTWVVANWALCTLFNGEGKMKRVAIYTAYSLVPYIVCSIISVFMTYFLTTDESIWISFISNLGLYWSLLLLIFGMKACHQYSFSQTILSMIFTVVGMLLILFVFVLMMSLFQQVWLFFYTIYTEILYRLRA